jgi:hypothetical protein
MPVDEGGGNERPWWKDTDPSRYANPERISGDPRGRGFTPMTNQSSDSWGDVGAGRPGSNRMPEYTPMERPSYWGAGFGGYREIPQDYWGDVGAGRARREYPQGAGAYTPFEQPAPGFAAGYDRREAGPAPQERAWAPPSGADFWNAEKEALGNWWQQNVATPLDEWYKRGVAEVQAQGRGQYVPISGPVFQTETIPETPEDKARREAADQALYDQMIAAGYTPDQATQYVAMRQPATTNITTGEATNALGYNIMQVPGVGNALKAVGVGAETALPWLSLPYKATKAAPMFLAGTAEALDRGYDPLQSLYVGQEYAQALGPLTPTFFGNQVLGLKQALSNPQAERERLAREQLPLAQQAIDLNAQGGNTEALANPVLDFIWGLGMDPFGWGSIGGLNKTIVQKAGEAEKFCAVAADASYAGIVRKTINAGKRVEGVGVSVGPVGKTLEAVAGLGVPGQVSNASHLLDNFGIFSDMVARTARNVDEFGNDLKLFAQSVSRDNAVAGTARSELAGRYGGAATSKMSQQSGVVLERMMTKGDGTLAPRMIDRYLKRSKMVAERLGPAASDAEKAAVANEHFMMLLNASAQKAVGNRKLGDVFMPGYAIRSTPDGGMKSTVFIDTNPAKRIVSGVNKGAATLFIGLNPTQGAMGTYHEVVNMIDGINPFYSHDALINDLKRVGPLPKRLDVPKDVEKLRAWVSPPTIVNKVGAKLTGRQMLEKRPMGILSRPFFTETGTSKMTAVDIKTGAERYAQVFKNVMAREMGNVERPAIWGSMPGDLRNFLDRQVSHVVNPQEVKAIHQYVDEAAQGTTTFRYTGQDTIDQIRQYSPDAARQIERAAGEATSAEDYAARLERILQDAEVNRNAAMNGSRGFMMFNDPAADLIHEMRQMGRENAASGDMLAQSIGDMRLQKETGRQMVLAIAGNQYPEGAEAFANINRYLSDKIVNTFKKADYVTNEYKAGRVPYETAEAVKAKLWEEMFTGEREALERDLIEAGDDASKRATVIVQHVDNANILDAAHTKKNTQTIWDQVRTRVRGMTAEDAAPILDQARAEVARQWQYNTRRSVTRQQWAWEQMGGDAAHGPLAATSLTAQTYDMPLLRRNYGRAVRESGLNHRHASNIVNRDRRMLGLPEVGNLRELDGPGYELAIRSIRNRQAWNRQMAEAMGTRYTEEGMTALSPAPRGTPPTTTTAPVVNVAATPRVPTTADELNEYVDRVTPIVSARAGTAVDPNSVRFQAAEIAQAYSSNGTVNIRMVTPHSAPNTPMSAADRLEVTKARLLADEMGLEFVNEQHQPSRALYTVKVRPKPAPAAITTTAPVAAPTVTTSAEVEQLYQSVENHIFPRSGATATGTVTQVRPLVQHLKDEVLANALAGPARLTAAQSDALHVWLDGTLKPAAAQAAAIAEMVGLKLRDYNNLNYMDTRLLEQTLGHFVIFSHFPMYSKIYWADRLARNPAILNNYLRFKAAQRYANRDLPEQYRDNFNFWLGNDMVSVNIENMFNVYGGINFFVDAALGKTAIGQAAGAVQSIGVGSLSPALTLPLGYYLYSQGNKEAASALWGGMGRLANAIGGASAVAREYIPGAASFIPAGGLSVKLGTDYALRRKAAGELEKMTESGLLTPEQAQQAAYLKSGATWDAAMQRAALRRAPTQAIGLLTGAYAQIRDQEQKLLEQVQSEYYAVRPQHAGPWTEEEKDRVNAFFAEHPGYTALILGKQNDKQADTTYAWSVLSRHQPGSPGAKDVTAAGIDKDLLSKFYDDPDFVTWEDADREKFMKQIVAAGEKWGIPDAITAQKWDDIKARKREIDRLADSQKPNGKKLEEQYYAIDDKDARKKFLDNNTDLDAYWDIKTALLMKDPEVAAYYLAPEKLKWALNDQVKAAIDKKYRDMTGVDMAAVNEEFERLGKPKQMYDQYPMLGRYRSELFAAYDAEKNTPGPQNLGVYPSGTTMMTSKYPLLGVRPAEYGNPNDRRNYQYFLGGAAPGQTASATQALAQTQGGGAPATGAATGGGGYIWGAPKTPYEFTFDMPFNPMGAPLSPQQLAEIEEKRKQIEILKQLNWVEPTKTTAGTTTGGATYAPKTGSTASTTTQPATTPPATGSSYVDQILAAASNPIAVTAQYGTYDELTKAITGAAFDARNAQYPDYAAMDAAFKAIPAWDKQARAKFYNDNPRYADAQNYLGNMLDFIKANPINPRPDAATVNAYLSAMSSVGIAPPVQSSYTPMRARGGGGAGGGYGGGGRAGRGTTPARLYGKLFSRMSPALQLALSQYFNSGVALSAEALQSLAGLGITDVEQLRPYFVQTRYSTSSQNATGNNQWWTPTPYRRGPTWRRW